MHFGGALVQKIRTFCVDRKIGIALESNFGAFEVIRRHLYEEF